MQVMQQCQIKALSLKMCKINEQKYTGVNVNVESTEVALEKSHQALKTLKVMKHDYLSW